MEYNYVAERRESDAIPGQTVVVEVPPYNPGKMLALPRQQSVAIALAPGVDRSRRTGEAIFCRNLPHDPVPPARFPPSVGEAQEAEGRDRVVPLRAFRSEVHKARLGRMKQKPVAAKAFPQDIEHALAVSYRCFRSAINASKSCRGTS